MHHGYLAECHSQQILCCGAVPRCHQHNKVVIPRRRTLSSRYRERFVERAQRARCTSQATCRTPHAFALTYRLEYLNKEIRGLGGTRCKTKSILLDVYTRVRPQLLSGSWPVPLSFARARRYERKDRQYGNERVTAHHRGAPRPLSDRNPVQRRTLLSASRSQYIANGRHRVFVQWPQGSGNLRKTY
jgi:hypothetical protein